MKKEEMKNPEQPEIEITSLAGKWEKEGGAIKFIDPSTPDPKFPFGFALLNRFARNGSINLEISLPDNNSSGRILFDYNSENGSYLAPDL